ncbi:MAG TPA: hypothetical protein PJ991_07180 [Kiritimatiellia bacterium]|nr:hypothetical protein [Kiritimatiellia bacterium]
MKWAHRLLGLLLGVLFTGALLWILLPAFQGGDTWRAFIVEISQQRKWVIAYCLVGIFGLLGFILTGIVGTPRSRYLAYETQHGNISISLKALQDFLGHIKGEFPSIIALNPKVNAMDESLEVVMEVKVRAGTPIPEVSRMLQERARVLINEKIGVSEIRDIEVKVEEIVREKDVKAQEIISKPPPAGETP